MFDIKPVSLEYYSRGTSNNRTFRLSFLPFFDRNRAFHPPKKCLITKMYNKAHIHHPAIDIALCGMGWEKEAIFSEKHSFDGMKSVKKSWLLLLWMDILRSSPPQ